MELTPLIVQAAESGQVLSLFYCNEESIRRMAQTGFVWRYSRSKRRQMMKGASSGNTQKIVSLRFDCDSDALLALVEQNGKGACHAGGWSCFWKEEMRSWLVLDELCAVIEQRRKKPAAQKNSFVGSIVGNRKAIGGKLVEEAGELAEALQKSRKEVVWEAADLLFFTLLALANKRVDIQQVLLELKRRRRKQAIKASGA